MQKKPPLLGRLLLHCKDCGSQTSGRRKGSERIAYRKVEGKAVAETL